MSERFWKIAAEVTAVGASALYVADSIRKGQFFVDDEKNHRKDSKIELAEKKKLLLKENGEHPDENKSQLAVRDYMVMHAHRAESQFVREDWHNGEHSEQYWKEFPVPIIRLGPYFLSIGRDLTYDIFKYLELREVLMLSSLSTAFYPIAQRLKSDQQFLRSNAIHGFPKQIRFNCWELIMNSIRSRSDYNLEYHTLVQGIDESSDARHVILRDIKRTFPDEAMFDLYGDGKGHNNLLELLTVYSLQDSDIGYTQGMNYLAGFLLMHTTTEKSFWFLDCLMKEYDQRWMFLPGLPHLTLFLWEFSNCMDIYVPKIARHLESNGIQVSMFAVEWFVTLFTYVLPRDTVERIWDWYLVDSWKVIFMVGLGLLKRSETSLLEKDMEGIIVYLKNFPDVDVTDPDRLIGTAKSFAISDFLLDELEEIYIRDVLKEGAVSKPNNQ